MTRQCARPECSATAAATLAYDYQQRTTWLDPLTPEAHPMSYDLCEAHADSLVVPRGWSLEDSRHGVAAEPSWAAPADHGASLGGAFAV